MRTLKLTIAYDGTCYAGWQAQKRSGQWSVVSGQKKHKPTIQGTLEAVLSKILQEPVKVIGSGRTDAGVHALAQVAHVRTRTAIPTRRLLRSVNALLPRDIAVLRIGEWPQPFHARFDAVTKRYRYRIFTGPVVPPFVRPYVMHVRVPLNVAVMRREAAALTGRHDVRAFARAPAPKILVWGGASRKGHGTIRTITRVRLHQQADEIHLEIEGTGFLHAMVRSIAGTLIDIGRGRLPPGTIRRMLRTGDRRLAGTTAPAHGLALVCVGYRQKEGCFPECRGD